MSDNKTIGTDEEKSNTWATSKRKNDQPTPKSDTDSPDKSKPKDQPDHREPPECTICFLPILQNNEQIVLEECGHIFHSGCIRLWMKQKRTCPFCAGFSLLPEEYPRLM